MPRTRIAVELRTIRLPASVLDKVRHHVERDGDYRSVAEFVKAATLRRLEELDSGA